MIPGSGRKAYARPADDRTRVATRRLIPPDWNLSGNCGCVDNNDSTITAWAAAPIAPLPTEPDRFWPSFSWICAIRIHL